MDVIILARQRSSRFPNKHLYEVNGETIIASLIRRFYEAGASWVVVATGPREHNEELAHEVEDTEGSIYTCELRDEFDVLGRVATLCQTANLSKFVLHSGDIVFPDFRYTRIVYDAVNPPDTIYAATGHPHPIASEQAVTCWASEPWITADAVSSKSDIRRETYGLLLPRTSEDDSDKRFVKLNPYDVAKTPVKASIDYPLEAAVAKRIVEYLGRWPRDPSELEDAYKGITEL